MIEYIEGNIFNSPAQVIVNTVNTVGVMGKGLALSFKKRYPKMFEAYKRACDKHQLTIGKLMLYYAPDGSRSKQVRQHLRRERYHVHCIPETRMWQRGTFLE